MSLGPLYQPAEALKDSDPGNLAPAGAEHPGESPETGVWFRNEKTEARMGLGASR